MIKQNQQGVTLIELLIAVTILSFVGILIWNIFIQGREYSNTVMTKNQMQQEANIILLQITKIHQTSDQYEINSDSCTITVETEDGSTEVFKHDRLCFSASKNVDNPIHPNEDNVKLRLTIQDKQDSDNELILESLLYRLKSGGSQ